ncbi:unnamed protein product, partial [Scytosiphon promiscuus]
PPAREFDTTGVTQLSAHDQEKLPYRIVGSGVSSKAGRRNIGYMYAIHHGAEVRVAHAEKDTFPVVESLSSAFL